MGTHPLITRPKKQIQEIRSLLLQLPTLKALKVYHLRDHFGWPGVCHFFRRCFHVCCFLVSFSMPFSNGFQRFSEFPMFCSKVFEPWPLRAGYRYTLGGGNLKGCGRQDPQKSKKIRLICLCFQKPVFIINIYTQWRYLIYHSSAVILDRLMFFDVFWFCVGMAVTNQGHL